MCAGLAALAVVAGCASVPPKDSPAYQEYVERNDPLEPMNRYFFEVNRGLDELFLKPAAAAYNAALPDPVQDSVRAFLNNLRTPIILINDLLQGDGDRAYITLSRFIVNTSIGLLGLFDVASEIKLDYHDEDFGQTLAVAGVNSGPYLMLPLLGPTNPRDLVGRVVDFAFDPLTYVGSFEARAGRMATDTVDSRNRNAEAIEALEEGSIDFYATVRDASRQRREDEIRNQRPQPDQTSPGVILDFDQ
ncbi:MAG: VacJ family lipoprotein [Rhodospirillales bacterium]|nr:VacJ family lipoprotein [Rhodospirillales bacterium]